MKKTVKGKRSAVDQAAVKTGRQGTSASASRKKAAKRSRTKPSGKRTVNTKPLEKKHADANRQSNRPADKKSTDTVQPGNKPAGKKRPVKNIFGAKKPAAKSSSSPQAVKQEAAAKQKSVKPVDKRSRKAAAKAMRNKQAAVKRHRYHGGNYVLYYILAGMIVITVLIILANTVLFKCKSIIVGGNARYTVEEIISNSGIEVGKNLLHINSANSAKMIESALAYIDSAKVRKSFPTGIEITVVEAEKWFCVRQGSITAAVSHGGKIVEHGRFDGLPLVIGMEAESVEVGTRLKSTIEGKNNIPATIFEAVESADINEVGELDISDRFSIKMKLDNGRIILELGTVSDMESKLKVAKEIIDNEIGAAESVTIILNNPIRATVKSNSVPESEPVTPNNPETSSASNSSDVSDDPQTVSG